MNLPILPIIAHILPLIAIYCLFWLLYRHVLKPNYRWYQRGNICYDYAVSFAVTWSIILYVIGLLIYYGIITFTLT